MSFPFDAIQDMHVDPNSICFIGMRYKRVPSGIGEPLRFKEEIDWEATAKASAVIRNIGIAEE